MANLAEAMLLLVQMMQGGFTTLGQQLGGTQSTGPPVGLTRTRNLGDDKVEVVGTQQATPTRITQTRTPHPASRIGRWYAIICGQDEGDIGVYHNWLVVAPKVSGVSGAIYKSFKNETDTEAYPGQALELEVSQKASAPAPAPVTTPIIAALANASFTAPPAATTNSDPSPSPRTPGFSPTPVPLPGSFPGPKYGTPLGGHPGVSGTSPVRSPGPGIVGNEAVGTPTGYIHASGVTPQGPDPSMGQGGLLYQLQANEDHPVTRAFSPPGMMVDGLLQLSNQALDTAAQRGTSSLGGMDESNLSWMADSLQAISTGQLGFGGHQTFAGN